ncbi:hypothetical protein QFC19_006745 [Naganishia cerealis]|uniref:Uncharacterized protein n=1 Tax=Naganishia cerealis TaxID=610337 RepID=A0ACC2VEI1_9TREE|nr:hypothetical protein QFC19_006745 [Naganishia cerealis]
MLHLGSVESLTPHPGHEEHGEHHDYAHLASHDHQESSHAHDLAEPRSISPIHPASRDSTSSTAIFDAEQEEQQGGPGKGRFALKKTGAGAGAGASGLIKDRLAGWDEEQGRHVERGDVWMARDVEETTAGKPFAGTAQGYVKNVPMPIDAPSTLRGGEGNELPGHPRMNSRTALFPTRTPTTTTTTTRRHRNSNASETADDRCPQGLGDSGGGVAGLNATLGLVIHAMADGVALGASSLSGSEGLGLVVFLAVIVHKGEWGFAFLRVRSSLMMPFESRSDGFGVDNDTALPRLDEAAD